MRALDDDELEPGAELGGWRLVRRLGAGGMATVWAAEHDGRSAALKIPRVRFATDGELRAMLLDEVRMARCVSHENVCRVFDMVQRPRLAIVMELLDGSTLAQRLEAGGALPLPDAVRLAVAVARGLHAAHEALDERGRRLELVHRDVSPSNVMLTSTGPKLIDFGIARARDRAVETSAGTLKGKLAYLAPEQVTRQPVSVRTDVYALGIVLWEMLTGRRYFDARNEVEVLLMARSPRPRPPSVHTLDLMPELDSVVLRALAPRPRDRFESAAALADALAASRGE